MHGLFLIFLIVFSADIKAADDDGSSARSAPVDARAINIRATLSEMRAIADARAEYNYRWARFLRDGRFGEQDTEVVEVLRNRLLAFAQNFGRKQHQNIALRAGDDSLRDNIPPLALSCEQDSRRMQIFSRCLGVVLMAQDQDLQTHVDKLFMFFHLAWCLREGESSKDREVSERYWMGVLRNKLATLVSPHVSLYKGLLRETVTKPAFTASNKVNVSSSFIEKMQEDWEFMQAIYRKIGEAGNISKCAQTVELLQDARSTFSEVIETEGSNAAKGWLKEVLALGKLEQIVFARLNFDSQRPLDFFRWFDAEVGGLMQSIARICQESERLKRKLSDILAKIRDSNPIFPPATTSASVRRSGGAKAALLRRFDHSDRSVSNSSAAAAAAATVVAAAAYRSVSSSSAATVVAAAAYRSVSNSSAAAAAVVAAAAFGRDDGALSGSDEDSSDDDLTNMTLTHYLDENDGGAEGVADANASVVAAEVTAAVVDATTVPVSVDRIFQARQVDYHPFLRQLARDFRDKISVATFGGNKTLLTLRHDGSVACAMYDTPHGTQLKKDYPHWRLAIQTMFKKVGLERQG